METMPQFLVLQPFPIVGTFSLVTDSFAVRTVLRKFYDKALTLGLEWYSQLHQHCYSRLANWDGKIRCIRHYHATCDVGKFETVDTFYRRTSSSIYVCNVCTPLLCISALDDPICTREAIPWDECRENMMLFWPPQSMGVT
ncbi:unnamed protein product [Prunus brigantina]